MELVSFGILLIIAVVILAVLYLAIKVAKYLIVNTILGLIILILAHIIGVAVPINWMTLLISAIAGIPGAILVVILYLLGIHL